MGEPEQHVYEVTLSPKGQVATARCSCGWMEKFRNTASSGPVEDLALAAANGHAPGSRRLTGKETEGQTSGGRNSAGGGTAFGSADRAGHEYNLTREEGGAVVSKCRCGWKTRFSLSSYDVGQQQDPEKIAIEYSKRHVAFATAAEKTPSPGLAATGGPPKSTKVVPVERQPFLGRPSTRTLTWIAAFIVLVGVCAYVLVRPTASERAEEREAAVRATAIDECDRMARLYDRGVDLPDLRRLHEERFGTESAVLDAIWEACPSTYVMLQEGTSSESPSPVRTPPPSPSDADSSEREQTTRRPTATPSQDSSNTRLSDTADAMASLYGYTLPGSAAGEGASLARITCERAEDGWDYETAVEDDISVGAPRDAAVGWNTFVYQEFCPALR